MRYFSKAKVSVLLLLFIWAGCETFDPGGIRDNSYDPKSDDFVPSKPTSLSFEIENGQILIKWKDISDFEDGYLVEKALSDTTNFVQIAKLDSNTTSYVDTSRTISTSTYYKVSSFIESVDQTKKGKNEIGILNYSSITSFDVEYPSIENTDLSWSVNSHFSDGIIIERKISNEKPFKQIKILENGENKFHESISNLETFNIAYRISTFKYHADSLL
ncbi:MAG: hypothetical protein SVR94_18605, partial [Pseudomonadota bacterium]|nr:hypothetical protein [Pseudomonadota bacterium]